MIFKPLAILLLVAIVALLVFVNINLGVVARTIAVH